MKIVWYLVLGAALLGIAAPGQAMESGTRAVYYAGKIHYVSVGGDHKVGYRSKAITTGNWTGPWDADPQTEIPLPSGWYRQDPDNEATIGEGVVIFRDQLLHFAVVLTDKDAPYLITSRVDLKEGKFTSGTVQPLRALKRTGDGAWGVAATVYGNKVYVFTNECTLVSDDGVNFRALTTAAGADLVLAGGLSNYVALDAVTFYPSGDGQSAKVGVLWGVLKNGSDGPYNPIFVVWDGQETSLPLPSSALKTVGTDHRFTWAGALAIGTVGGRYDESSTDTFPPGAKEPVVQIFTLGQQVSDSSYHVWQDEYYMDRDPSSPLVEGGHHSNGHTFLRLRVYPWYLQEQDAADKTLFWTRQLIVLNSLDCTANPNYEDCRTQGWDDFPLTSDYMRPVHQAPDKTWDGVPNSTVAPDDPTWLPTLQSYWTLVGVVLGPAPFAINDREDSDVQDTSNVSFGTEQGGETQHTESRASTVMASSATEVQAGLAGLADVKASLDLGFKYSWEQNHGQTTSASITTQEQYGTNDEAAGNFGQHGWAIFSCPNLLVQEQDFYAYDRATLLGQGLYTVAQGSDPSDNTNLVLYAEVFSLQDPSQSDHPGLLSGMLPFPQSTDLAGWSKYVWEDSGKPWTVKFGSGNPNGGIEVPAVQQGTTVNMNFTKTATDIDGGGTTKGVSIEAGTTLSMGTKLLGFEETLEAGYDSEWSTEVTATTTVSQWLTIDYHMPLASDTCQKGPDCIVSLTVQPYLLTARNDDGTRADWVPDNYAQDLPWAIAWRVLSYKYADGKSSGTTAPPTLAQGTVAGTASTYRLQGGHLAWLQPDGSLGAVPMSADQFDPHLGATVHIRDLQLDATDAHGTWSRTGTVWSYRTAAGTSENAFTLTLDFGRGTWSFAGSALDLARYIPAGDRAVRIELTLNDRFGFFSVVPHALTLDWQLAAAPVDSKAVEVTAYSGHYESTTGTGTMHLAGTLPATMTAFGDLSFVTNGRQVDIPLLAQEGFAAALEGQGSLAYASEGTGVAVDLGQKTWSVDFAGSAFNPRMAARQGGARIGLNVGGQPWHDAEHPVLDFTAGLDFACVAGTPATDFAVTRGGLRLNRQTGHFVQSVTLKNRTARPIVGPVSLALDGLSANATLVNKTSSTLCSLPAGSPYVDVPIGSDNVLGAGESATVALEFINSNSQGIVYNTRALRGAGTR